MNTKSSEGGGRKPPPTANRYQPGRSGNPRGRPRGAVSTKLITKKVALKRLTQTINAKHKSLMLLEWVILAVRSMQMEGHAGAARIVEDLKTFMIPAEAESLGVLLVPEVLTPEEWSAQIVRHNADHPFEPGTEEYERWNRRGPETGQKNDSTFAGCT